MDRRNLLAVATAAGLASGVCHGAPTITYSLVIAGSSAALNAVRWEVQTNLCGPGSNFTTYASVGASQSFEAWVCNPNGNSPAAGAPGISRLINGAGYNDTFAVYYRTEGDSIVGVLPIISGKPIARLDLSSNQAYIDRTACNIAVGSVTADTWSSCTVKDTVQLGIVDLEPGKLTGADYPSDFSSAAYGVATPTQLANVELRPVLFQQVFGLYVNTNVPHSSGAFATPISLSKATAYNIYVGNITDWSHVPDARTGNPVMQTGHYPITIIDSGPGSGARAAANIYFLNYHCGGSRFIPPAASSLTTTEVLNELDTTPGALAYLSIDNGPEVTTGVAVQLNGVAPSNLTAAAGAYDYWFEAEAILNPTMTSGTPSDTVASYLLSEMQNLATAPHAPDINVIAGYGDNPSLLTVTVPVQSSGAGTAEIYLNPFSRGGNSCNIPTP